MNKNLEKTDRIQTMTVPEKIVFIEQNSEQILTNPQENLYKFQNLLNLLKGTNLFIIKVAALAMAEILKDVAPMFSLDKTQLEEKLKQVISKDERKLIQHEYSFLIYYEKYLQEMNKIKEALKNDKSQQLREFEVVLLQCFTELYKKLYFFNFNTDLLNFILKYLLSKHKQISEIVHNFMDFILKENNANYYKSKLVVLEKLGFFLKKRKFFNLIGERVWEIYADIVFDYAQEVTEKVDKVKKQEDYLTKLNELRDKGKLSKRRMRELKGKQEILEKMRFKQQKEDQKKKLMKVINKEMKEQEATVSTKKTQKISKQILLKIFYINFKVISEYPEKHAFIWVLRSIDKNYKRVDPTFLKDLQSTLKGQFEFFQNHSKLGLKAKIQRKLMILNLIIKISQQKNMGLEVEEYYSTSCFYEIMYTNLQEDNIFNKDFKQQLAVIYLLENLLLNKKIFNVEVIDNFARVILLNIYNIKEKSDVVQTMLYFYKVFMDRYLKYYKTHLLDDDSQKLSENVTDQLLKQKQILSDPFMDNVSQFPFKSILEKLKKRFKKEQKFVHLINLLINDEPLATKFLCIKPSQYFKNIEKRNNQF